MDDESSGVSHKDVTTQRSRIHSQLETEGRTVRDLRTNRAFARSNTVRSEEERSTGVRLGTETDTKHSRKRHHEVLCRS